ncbi:hypothetical protein GALMADRAFT_243693 [Galerina marginata CBS 339.88]|uniref:F-box domain-containing protein n=1 Tax=Galerina marginata (strain CBS 339.88) TaxID=685588 RepID=A0A067T8Y5_GALM3|nr:hypothetical protein GALMADRAFT_243693 [Galerina marginata CBS 339.88]
MSLLTPSQQNIHVPVLRLHRDVFLSIIKLNADMFSDPSYPTALSNTRFASQVCRDWRDMILEAPSLWAKLIDLDNFVYFKDHWWHTVLKRSGNASLWIRATSQIHQARKSVRQKIYGFLFSVLDKHWGRVEELIVCIAVRKLKPQLWRSISIYRPAPRLQVFDVDFDGIPTGAPSTLTSNTLFADDAPLLHTIHLADIKFNPQATWATNIRSIHIGPPFTLLEMLSAFKMMPQLEDIRVEHVQSPTSDKEEVDRRQLVNLPYLTNLRLFCDFKSGISFLENITHARGCFLTFDTFGNWEQGPFRPLSKVALDYFTTRVPTSIALNVSPYGFSIEDKTDNLGPFQRFSIHIKFGHLRLTTPATGPIVAGFTFPTPVFQFVTQLYLPSLTCSPSETDFHAFFRSLPAVTTLIANEQVIGDFLNMQKETSDILFPLLEVVKLDILNITYFRGSSGYLFQFLLARRDLAHPISVLDLREVNSDVAPSLTFLEELTGMQVLWRRWGVDDDFKYECGSGNPEMLPF